MTVRSTRYSASLPRSCLRLRSTRGFPIFNPNATRRDVEQFMLAFDTDLAPIVGQQVTLTNVNATTVGPRIDLLIQRARTTFVSKALRRRGERVRSGGEGRAGRPQ